MSLSAFRNALFAQVQQWQQDNYPDLRVVYENADPLDESETAQNAAPWAELTLRFYSGNVTGLGPTAPGRHHGALAIYFYSRRGTGTAATDEMIESFGKRFSLKSIEGGVLRSYEIAVATEFFGWYKCGLFIPLHLDEGRT